MKSKFTVIHDGELYSIKKGNRTLVRNYCTLKYRWASDNQMTANDVSAWEFHQLGFLIEAICDVEKRHAKD